MNDKSYVAYVGTYTHGKSKGIHMYDVDMKEGKLTKKKEIVINNSSYLTKSRDGKYLYTIADEGVEAYKILAHGEIELINKISINGMRGCYLTTDYTDKYLFVAGYHDGKVTVILLDNDGSLIRVTDEKFHKGLGSVAERSFRPHVSCVAMTPDNKYLCAVDLGIDHVKIYQLNYDTGAIKMVDILRCPPGSAPRHILFSEDGFAYLICELTNTVMVYGYEEDAKKNPNFILLQTLNTLEKDEDSGSAATAMEFSPDGEYLLCSNAGENNVAFFKVKKKTGLLKKKAVLPVSGEYPKDIAFFPDGKHFMSLNHESNTITVFTIDCEKGLIVMKGKPLPVEMPNCIAFAEV